MKIALLVVMLLMIGCSKENNWPYPMTSFFAECEYEGIVFVDRAYTVSYTHLPLPTILLV